MTTAGAIARAVTERLVAVGIDTARLDARLLVAEVLGVEPNTVFTRPEMPVTAEQGERIDALAARRASREPMSHILGRRGFWSLTLTVTADTLDPRPDTETVVQAVLDRLTDRERAYRVLDFGTGTGAILLALLSELPNATGVGVDRSPAALKVARHNAESLGLAERAAFVEGDWGRGLHGLFDAIVSNPPYIPDEEIAGLEPEVAEFEPRLALAGGTDGLDCYRALGPDIARLLSAGGVAALEVGQGQDGQVSALLEASGLVIEEVRADLGGIGRCVVARRP